MYRINNSLIYSAKANDFQLISQCYDHGTRLRNNRNYCLPRVRTKLGQNMTIFSETKIWNGINKQLKELSFRTFKQTFKNQLISKQRCSPRGRPWPRGYILKSLALASKVKVLDLGVEASSPQKLACPRLEDSTIF